MTRYRVGADFERAVRHHLEDEGYEVIRSAGSKTKIDLVAFKVGVALFCQCKTNGKIPPAERVELLRLANMISAIPIVAWKRPGSTTIHLDRLVGVGPHDREPYLTDQVAARPQATVVSPDQIRARVSDPLEGTTP